MLDKAKKIEKQLIQTQQAMQVMHEQMQTMETYYNRLQVSQAPH